MIDTDCQIMSRCFIDRVNYQPPLIVSSQVGSLVLCENEFDNCYHLISFRTDWDKSDEKTLFTGSTGAGI